MNARSRLTRCWINQPSTLQDRHTLHASNVLAALDDDINAAYVTVWFTAGNIISSRIARDALSYGWTQS